MVIMFGLTCHLINPTSAIARCLRDGHWLRDVPQIYENADMDFEWEPLYSDEEELDDHNSLIQLPPRCLTTEQVAHTQRPGKGKQAISLQDLLPPPL